VNNIFYILVDSVRNYKKDNDKTDDRDKLDFMFEFEDESVYFSNMATSAPSTIMSVSAMMTSQPAYYIAKSYDDFRYNRNTFFSLSWILKDNGFKNHSIIFFKEGREKFNTLFDHIPLKYLPRNTRHFDKEWTNKQIYDTFCNYTKNKFNKNEKNFFYVHYNCRNDINTSRIVKDTISKIKELDNDSLIILCSDHGYPDPDRGYSPEKMKKEFGTHDVIMSNDNLLIPFYIRFPKGNKKGKFDHLTSTLDITPTILNILNIDYVDFNLKGQNLLDENYKDNLVRSDARYLYQDGRRTSIMNKEYKLIYNHDNDTYEVYAYNNDFLEEKNLKNSDEVKINVFVENALEYFYDTEAQSLFNLIMKEEKEINNKTLFVESVHGLNNKIFEKLNIKLAHCGYDLVNDCTLCENNITSFMLDQKAFENSLNINNDKYQIIKLFNTNKVVKKIIDSIVSNMNYYQQEPMCLVKDLVKKSKLIFR